MRVRPAAVAGSFYPAEPNELRESLHECFTSHRLGPQGKRFPSSSLLGGIVPHAGYVYSGPCAAHFYSCLNLDARCVVLLGVNHGGGGARAALSPLDHWETPLGKVQVDQDLARELKHRSDLLEEDEEPHLREHSIEVQLPFLQSLFSDFTFLPLSLSYLSDRECEDLGLSVARVYEAATAAGKKTVIVASSDLSHYLSPKETERLDQMALEPVLALDPSGLLKTVEEENISMCGVIPAAVFLFAAKALGAKQAQLLKHCHSGDAVPMREVVGYASVAVEL
ncbi:MAG TPA: AmmeMemoRadiSam system protein B [Candidatus Binatia bacterium]|nr:AmmeMemoRadiSam system protein B [Candidatus Binatia bacterium]